MLSKNLCESFCFWSCDSARFRAILCIKGRDKWGMRTPHQKTELSNTNVFVYTCVFPVVLNDSKRKEKMVFQNVFGCVNEPFLVLQTYVEAPEYMTTDCACTQGNFTFYISSILVFPCLMSIDGKLS